MQLHDVLLKLSIIDLTDKPNQNQNLIESESGEKSKGDINIS